jgi:hypothetical protein
MDTKRKLAIAAGVCYIVTHITSVAASILHTPLLHNVNYVAGSSPDTSMLVGALLELILAVSIIGTAVALFPVVKRQSDGVSLGYVGLRTLEAGIIAVGVVPVLDVVTLKQQVAGIVGAHTTTLATVGKALVQLHNWTVVLGPGLVCSVNTVLLAYLMYTSKLVPRFIPVLGLVGAPLVFGCNAALLIGLSEYIPSWVTIGVLPIFAWEVSLAIYLIAKGFKLSASVIQAVTADA